LRVDAWSVNWLTASNSPPTSAIERFMMPASSSKMRRLTIFRASQSRSASVSARLTPQSTRRPGPIAATIRPSTVTLA
jgi:hypothetical protein